MQRKNLKIFVKIKLIQQFNVQPCY